MNQAFFNLLLIAFVFPGFCNCAIAEKTADSVNHDYVIISNGDTIRGRVLHLGAASVKIEPIAAAPTVVYKFAQVREINRKGISYGPVASMIGVRKNVFAQRILQGKIDLFVRTIHGRYGDLIAYYAGKKGVMPMEVQTNGVWPKGLRSKRKRMDNLAALIADNEELARDFATKAEYSSDDLIELVKRYNLSAGLR